MPQSDLPALPRFRQFSDPPPARCRQHGQPSVAARRSRRAASTALALVLTALLGAAGARADVAEVITGHARPGFATFAVAASALDRAAQGDCDPAPLRPLVQDAADAWMQVAHLRLGPSEERNRNQAVNFWPDPKDSGGRTQAGLIRDQNPVVHDPEAFARISVAVRGLPALERLLFAPDAPGSAYACDLLRAVTRDLAASAAGLQEGWNGGIDKLLLSAGQEGNTLYLSPAEARQSLFTQLVTGLGFNADQRLARPLGNDDRPRPERAEAQLSGRSVRNIVQSLTGLRILAEQLSPESHQTLSGIDSALGLAKALENEDPVLAGVATPEGRAKAQALQAAILAARTTALAEMATDLGVGLGFNAADGD